MSFGSIVGSVPVAEGEARAIGSNEVHGAIVVITDEGIEAFGCFFGGAEGFGEAGGIFTAATIGAGMTGLDFELEGIFRAGDGDTLAWDELTIEADGLDGEGSMLFREDGIELAVEGDDVEAILPLSNGDGMVTAEVFAVTDVEVSGDDLGLEELEGAVHGVLSLCCPALEDNHHKGKVKGGFSTKRNVEIPSGRARANWRTDNESGVTEVLHHLSEDTKGQGALVGRVVVGILDVGTKVPVGEELSFDAGFVLQKPSVGVCVLPFFLSGSLSVTDFFDFGGCLHGFASLLFWRRLEVNHPWRKVNPDAMFWG